MLLFSIFSSCKKNEVVESEEIKFEKAMLAAGFKKVNNADIPNGITSYQLGETEIKEIAEKGFSTIISNKVIRANNKLQMNASHASKAVVQMLSIDKKLMDAPEIEIEGVGGETIYSITIRSTYWSNDPTSGAFPDIARITFKKQGSTGVCTDVNSGLYYEGPNAFGNFYTHESGTASISGRNIGFATIGIYSESYGVGGLFSWVRNYRTTINGNIISGGDGGATINYQRI